MTDSLIKEHLCKFKDEISFSFLTDEELEKIACFFELFTYPANTIIFKEGAPGDFIGFVISGKLEVKKQTEFKGNQLIIAILSKGAFVGELSMFGKHNRSATVEALEDTTMIILRNDAFDALIEQYPEIGVKILKGFIQVLSLRLRKVTERLTTIF